MIENATQQRPVSDPPSAGQTSSRRVLYNVQRFSFSIATLVDRFAWNRVLLWRRRLSLLVFPVVLPIQECLLTV